MVEIKEEFLLDYNDAFRQIEDLYQEMGLTKDQVDNTIIDSIKATGKKGNEIGNTLFAIMSRSFRRDVFKELHKINAPVGVEQRFVPKMKAIRSFIDKNPHYATKVKSVLSGSIETKILERLLKNI